MPSKYQRVSELADQIAQDVTRGGQAWKGYLDTASRLYKYSFDDQLLIYAQRPDATACASMELWNGTMHRWVRSGSKGIALIRKDSGRPHLEYVFDVADTRPVRGAKVPYLWSLREEHHDAVLSALERRYGATQGGDTVQRLMDAAAAAVREVYRDHLRDLAYDASGSFLEGLDDLNLEVRYRNLLTASVQYTLLTRCGYDANDYIDDEELDGIREFSTSAVLHHLGDAANSISKDLLLEIGAAIRTYDRTAAQERENNSEKPLANPGVIGYTTGRDNFNNVNRKSDERSAEHERTDIHEGGRLPAARPADGRGGRAGGNAPGQVRDAAGDVSEGTPSRDVHVDAADREAGRASAGDRRTGAGAGGPDREGADEARRRGRGVEGQRSDGMGAGGQQLHGTGGGNGAGGDRLQVSSEEANTEQAAGSEPAALPSAEGDAAEADAPSEETPPYHFALFPSVEEQVENIAEAQAEEARPAAQQTELSMPENRVPEAVIGRALTAGGNEPHSIERIVAHFQKFQSPGDTVRFLREEFKPGGKGVTIAGRDYALLYDEQGLHIAAGRTAHAASSTFVSWPGVAQIISDMLTAGTYAPQEKIDSARENEFQELAQKLAYMRQDFSDEAIDRAFLPALSEAYEGNLFPEINLQIAELLKKPEKRAEIIEEMTRFVSSYQEDRTLLRFRPPVAPMELLARLRKMNEPVKEFHALEGVESVHGSFVTEDEIDQLLQRGGSISEGKIRIYAYFMQGHNAQECVSFLRKEYGEGGFGMIGYNESHGSKGIKFTRQDEFSGYSGYDTVTLNWNQVQKRIRAMVENRSYLNEKEQAYLPQYERLRIAREIYAFHYYNPNDAERTYPHEWDVSTAEKEILPLLNTPGQAEAMFERMKEIFAAVSPENRAYSLMESAMRDLGAFIRGEYSLFTPLPEAELEAERQKEQQRKQEKREGRKTAKEKSAEPEPAPGTLAAAARALARKLPAKTGEEPSGQFSLFQADAEPEQPPLFDPAQEAPTPAQPEPPKPPRRNTTVVETILSPDLEREARDKDAARKQAVETLSGRGIEVSERLMDYLTGTLGRDAVHADRIVARVEEILHPPADPEAEEKYHIGYAFMGNGLTVWNSLEEENGDYKTIAHIDPDRSFRFYDENLPESVKNRIIHIAATSTETISASQNSPVFSVPPMIREQSREMAQKEQENVPAEGEAPVFITPEGFTFRPGDNIDALSTDGGRVVRVHIEQADDNRVVCSYMDGDERKPMELPRDRFDGYVDSGRFTLVPTVSAEAERESAESAVSQADEPEPEKASDQLYKVGDTVYLEHTAYEIAAIYESSVQLLDPSLPDPVFRSENRQHFEDMLRLDSLNHFITDYLPANLEAVDNDLQDVLIGEGGLASGRAREQIAGWLRSGMSHSEMSRRLALGFENIDKTMTLATGETANYFTSYYGLSYEIRNKDNSGHTYPWGSIAPVLRAMYQPDREGYFYSPALPEPEPKRKNRAKDDNAPAISGPEQPERKKAGRTRAEVNYRTFAGLFPEMIDGEYRYMRFECGASMMPLHVQWIEDDVIAISHTYEVEGDLLYDPEMTFRVDRDAGTLEPLTFQQDGTIQLYQEVYPAPGKWIPKLRNDLSAFARQWFSNITEQRYFKVRAVKEIDGEDAEFTFDKDGNPIAEVDPFLSQRRREAIAESSPWWADYLDVKAEHIDEVVLYQVGDFFELYGEDAEQAAALLDLRLGTKAVEGVGRVLFCGVPANSLERYTDNLRDKYDLVVSSDKEGGSGRRVYEIPSIDREAARALDAHEAEFGADGYRAFPGDAPDAGNSEPEIAAEDAELPPAEAPAAELSGVGVGEGPKSENTEEPDLTPNVEQYLNLKAEHPDKLIGVQVGKYLMFYGKDAEEAAPALGRKVLTRDIPGLGETSVTGYDSAWQAAVKTLLEHGKSAVFAHLDQERGPDAPYEIITESDAADYIPIGMELVMDGRRMKIDSVDFDAGTVSLRDMELQGWYPIFRSEPIEFVRSLVEEVRQSEEYIAADDGNHHEPESPPESEQVEIDGGQLVPPVREETVKMIHDERLPYDIEIRTLSLEPERHDFHITDENLGAVGQKTKYQNNVAAIRTLHQIEGENRLATPEEQEILSQYVGWGGLAQAFDPDNDKWTKEYAELKELLTPEEYASARSTVLNAHYTSPQVINAVYEAVKNMDFRPGNVLEPSCGIGNFFGLFPREFSDAKLYGVELDSLTGRIARQLYQNAEITVDGFENTDHPDDFFDLAVGNVPFGEYHVHDKRYDRYNLLIHDYFIAKTLDKVRPGGIVAFVTSKGTMDKKNSKVREMLAQKADLLGAIRLPNNAFKANAGTEVTTDILFFQKRDHAPEKLPGWVESGLTKDGIPLNTYYLENPEMVLGTMSFWANMYGNETETACLPLEGANLTEQLSEAVKHIAPPNRELLKFYTPGAENEQEVETIPADPKVRNYSYTVKGSKVYFRENSYMKRVELGKVPTQRVKGMIAIRDCARNLIDLQINGAGDEEVKAEQDRLNRLYDQFTKQFGLLNSPGNRMAFNQDSSYPLLCSLELLDEEGNLERKADMFTKRTIKHHTPVTSVDTAVEALGVSIGERACVDLGYMAQLLGGAEKIPQIVKDLRGVIFKDPATGPFDIDGEGVNWFKGWQPADEYLSGNVRRKLAEARAAAEEYPEFAVNVEALEKVQPVELSAAEINVRIGAPWIDPKYYRQFIFELLQTPWRAQERIGVLHSKQTDEWRVTNKSADGRGSPLIYATYGTSRRSAYEIFENMLNQRDSRVFDTKEVDGKEVRVLNQKETMLAMQRQDVIAMKFQDWIFKDPERRADLVGTYNRLFNSVRPREYNGEHIQFAGMSPEIRLEPHQRNAVARILYGGNTLLAHCVGAGKTFEMTAAAMESKRLGLCQKSLFVVPNHLTEQWGGDFLRLYPGAKVLVATKKDFQPKNRKKFCARIATGDYDAVIIGHSQFEKIPISPERQQHILEAQIDEIMEAIAEAKEANEEKFTIKQMERTRKGLEAKLKKLTDKKKDDTVTFEELGVDRLFVDEAHYYKNLYLFSKMRNVAGISQTEAQKSSDMFAKCRYMDEITGGKGVCYATGTPISNTMCELYTMMRYLQFDMLEEAGLSHFDDWAATFGEKVTSIELKPEGTGFRPKTRFARFYNLPELMNLWKEAADIQTADMLKLPVPEAEYVTISTEPSAAQKEMVKGLADRAEEVRSGSVDPSRDNMLKITSDGRKLALDQRIMNPLLPDDPNSKVNRCVENVFNIWQETAEKRSTQLIFSDLSTPKGKAASAKNETKSEDDAPQDPDAVEEDAEAMVLEASVYEDIRKKLIAKGVPPEEIAFIHEANTEAQKAEMFAKVRSGQIRILLGSTQKMGAGTNVQTKLIASHDLDCPWRPADLEQRAGRIVRRGNENEKVQIFRYVTKGTFDAYNWSLVENKQKFIGQVMTSKSPARSIEDVDATALSYAEVKMIATGDVRIKEKMDLDIQVAKLKLLQANHRSIHYALEDKIIGYYPRKIAETQMFIEGFSADLLTLNAHPVKDDAFTMTVMGKTYTDRKEAGQAIINSVRLMSDPEKPLELGEYRGFPMTVRLQGDKFRLTMKRNMSYSAELGDDPVGNVQRINNALEQMPKFLANNRTALETLQQELKTAQEEVAKPFEQEAELEQKSARLSQLNAELESEEKGGGAETKDSADGPAREDLEEPEPAPAKPSIRAQLRAYAPPARVAAGPERAYSREAVL